MPVPTIDSEPFVFVPGTPFVPVAVAVIAWGSAAARAVLMSVANAEIDSLGELGVTVTVFVPSVILRVVPAPTVPVGAKVYANVPGVAVLAVKVLVEIDAGTRGSAASVEVNAAVAGVAAVRVLGIVVTAGASGVTPASSDVGTGATPTGRVAVAAAVTGVAGRVSGIEMP
jgi:hypothetical protein